MELLLCNEMAGTEMACTSHTSLEEGEGSTSRQLQRKCYYVIAGLIMAGMLYHNSHEQTYICDPLWEKVHFRAKCNIELGVKIAESGLLVVKLDYDTRENYSLSSTFSRWSDVRAPLLALTASSQRRKVRSERTCTVRVNNRMCGVNTIIIRVTKETLG